MDENFIKLAQEIHNERVMKEQREMNTLEGKIKTLRSLFWLWCKAFEKNEYNSKHFIEFAKLQNLNFYIKKAFLEKYFNFKFSFNQVTNKWIIKTSSGEVVVYES